jgi:drug/metabolite transporter (DMT)-like permease
VITRTTIERDLVIVACAISAGIHAALTPDHWTEGAAAGAGFAIATVLLAVLALALTRGLSSAALAGAAVLFGGLLVSYGLAVTSGLPVFHPHPEAVDGLALFTKAVELVGLFAAAHLLSERRSAFFPSFSRLKGRLA